MAGGFAQTGVYRLYRVNAYDFLAQCVMDNANGKTWMVMQKRNSDAVAFSNRTFEDYAVGFGEPSSNHWLGLRNVRKLIDAGYNLQLRIEIEGDRCGRVEEDLYYVGTWNFLVCILINF